MASEQDDEKDSKIIHARVSLELHAELEKEAAAVDRSLSSHVRMILKARHDNEGGVK